MKLEGASSVVIGVTPAVAAPGPWQGLACFSTMAPWQQQQIIMNSEL